MTPAEVRAWWKRTKPKWERPIIKEAVMIHRGDLSLNEYAHVDTGLTFWLHRLESYEAD